MKRPGIASLCLLIVWCASPPAHGEARGPLAAPQAQSRTVDSIQPITLPDAITTARARAPRGEAVRARISGARDAVAPAGRPPNPTFEWLSENWQFGAGDPGAPLTDTFALVSQAIEIGGKGAARRRVAEAQAASLEAEGSQFDRDLVLSVTEAYLAAVRARRLTELLGAQRQSGSEVIALTKRRVDEGFAPEADLRKFEVEVARVDAQLVRAWLDLGRACALLGARIGWAGDVEPGQLVDPVIPPPSAGDFSEQAAAVVATRPEVVASQRRLDTARATLALERGRRLPDPVVTGGYKRTDGFNTGVVGVGVPVPLSDRNGAAIARATGEERAAAFELDAVTREARVEIESELRAAAALAERAQQVERDFLVPADIVRRAARSAFREGGGDVLRLVDAERVYIDSQREALDLRLEAVFAAVRARLALGREVVP